MRSTLELLKSTLIRAAAMVLGVSTSAVAADEPVKVGVLLPYTGTYAELGDAITNGMKLAIDTHGGQLGGREVEYIIVDSEANPGRAPQNASKLIVGEGVDFLVGPVHSGVAMGMLKVAREEGTITIIPNAGLNAATRELCAPNVFRTSFSAWQISHPMGQIAVDRGYDRVVTMAWNYSFGKQSVEAFEEGYTEAGGTVVERILTPFPEVEFQAYLTEIASLKPDAVFVFYAGGGAVKFVKDFAALGLNQSIQLLGTFLTDGTLEAQGDAAEGILTVLHYADGLDNPVDRQFRASYQARFGKPADVYAVQGYDTGLLLVVGMEAVGGNTEDEAALIAAMEAAEIDSPRGRFTFSQAHHPIQTLYLREAKAGRNQVVGVAAESLADPGTGCPMME